MTHDLFDNIKNNSSREFNYKLAKGTVLVINVEEIVESIPTTVWGASNGNASLSDSYIYYSPKKDFIGIDELFFITIEDSKQVISKVIINVASTFKPKAHILTLLGEELIKSPVMAIYELIKNGYDADASNVDVLFDNIENLQTARIIITDSGTGITEEVLENVWFEPGTDFRKPINEEGIRQINRSPIFRRIPMGEKGVGRFAVHKLGNKIRLVSRPAKIEVGEKGNAKKVELLNYELIVDIDWRQFTQSKYLDDVSIEWKKNINQSTFNFKENHGTLIEINSLKEEWTRGMARQLKRQTISMLSPKNDPSKFKINLNFNNWWLNNLPETAEILEEAPYKVVALVDESFNLTFEYYFSLLNNEKIGERKIDNTSLEETSKAKYKRNIKGELRPFFRSFYEGKGFEKEIVDKQILNFENSIMPYGSLMLELYSFDLDSISLRDTTFNPSLIKGLLKDHAGIKVFKGDLRVYDYGDPGNDWLGLDLKRIQNKEWFSNNQNIGFVYLDPETSGSLVEKTDREGFIENECFHHFLVMLDYLLTEFKAERNSDRGRWLLFNKKGPSDSFESKVTNFRSIITNDHLTDEEKKNRLLAEADKIEEQYEKDKTTLLIPAGVGMTASFALHEIEKLVPRMEETVFEEPIVKAKIVNQVEELKDYVEGILSILKKGGNKPISLLDSINQAVNNYSLRLKNWKINVEIDHENSIQSIKCDKRLLITMLMNLLDNSIYWLDTIYKEDKGVYVGTRKRDNGVSIIVADNGPGFRDNTEDLIRPFFTRKEGGIGIGLYLIDTVMIQYGKLNIIFDNDYLDELNIPSKYRGAVVELVFSKIN